ncbi:MAG: hypothetical protein GF381_00995 [Candidatus Pacebacteria bacterium]|nr:hypothetical protein [Candidatus Paceibacterota bacterium]
MKQQLKLVFIGLGSLAVLLIVLFLQFYSPEGWLAESQSAEQASPLSLKRIQPTPTQEPEQKLVRILFAGDLMFDRHIRLAAEKHDYSYPLDPLTDFLQQYDLVVVNLEGPITDFPSRSVGSQPGSTDNYFFTFDPQIVEKVLLPNQIKLVNLGNNHILNFGLEGWQQTLNYLELGGIEHFGQVNLPLDQNDDFAGEASPIGVTWQKQGVKIGLVNYNQFSGLGLDPVLAEINQLRPAVDYLVAYTHWGNEYVPQANAVIQSWAHQLIDAGADIVIGSHPHVIQNVEDYQGGRIYYSLGNFVFDQYFEPAVRQGLLVEVELVGLTGEARGVREVRYQEYQVEMRSNSQTKLVE